MRTLPHQTRSNLYDLEVLIGLLVGAWGTVGWMGSALAATYQVIEPPPGFLYVTPNAVSPDGSAVVGDLEGETGKHVAFLWTAAGGIEPILLSGYPNSLVKMSDDFSVGVGTGYVPDVSRRDFVWSVADGARSIEPLSGETSTAWEAFSADGSTILGFSSAYTERAFSWTAATGTQEIATPAPIVHFMSISRDGTSAAGYTTQGAMYWSTSTGAQFLPSELLPGAPYPLVANLISADGSRVAFQSVAPGIWRVGLWTVGGSAVEISLPFGETGSRFTPSKISANGSTLLLQSNESSGHHVLRWTNGNGSQSLTLPGFFSTDVAGNGMSVDGSTVILAAQNDCAINCNQTAFVWKSGSGLHAIPPPAGQDGSYPAYVSADGARVGGNFYGTIGDRGFVWSDAAGVETLEPVPGDVHSYVQTISADGKKVTGGSCTADYALCRGVVWTLSAPPGQNEVPTPASPGVVTVSPVVSLPGGGGQVPVQVTFDSISSAGTTTVTASTDPSGGVPASPPTFAVGDPPVYYDVDTTATFAAPVTICFSWLEGQFQNEGGIALFHFESGAWQLVTPTSLDMTNNKICGQVSSLSPFALFERTYAFSGFFQPVDNQPTRNTSKAGAAVPVKFSLNGNQGLAIFASGYPASHPLSCSGTVSDAVEELSTASASGLTYDASTNLYSYVWKTDKAWAKSCRRLTLKLNDGSVHSADFEFGK